MNDDYTYVATDKGLGKFSFLAGVAAKGIRDDDFCSDVRKEDLAEDDDIDEEEDEDEEEDKDKDKDMDDSADKTGISSNKELEEICRAMANDSTEHLINVVLGGGSTDCEFFTNGLRLNTLSEGPLHCPIVETQRRKASFLASWSGPSAILRALPFIWQRRTEPA